MRMRIALAALLLGQALTPSLADARGFGGGGFHYGGGGFGGGFHYSNFGGYGGGFGGYHASSYGGYHANSYGGYGGFHSTNVGGYGAYGYGGYHGATYAGYRPATGSYGVAHVGTTYGGTYGGYHASTYHVAGVNGVGGYSFRAMSPGVTWGGGTAYRIPTDAGLARYSTYGLGAARFTTAHWSNYDMATRAATIRRGFLQYGAFTPAWYGAHVGAWYPAAWAAGAAWNDLAWSNLYSDWGVTAAPIDYDYGTTVVTQGDGVSVGGETPIPADQYAQQASAIAAQGQAAVAAPAAAQPQWQPLGVFALAQGDQTDSNVIVQLAIDPATGTLRGNYYDSLTDSATPIVGAVDKTTQRAAWTVGDKKFPCYEAGIYNLTKDQAPVLVHFSAQKGQQWLLVRIKQPPAGNQTAAAGN